ncbi:LysR family transcriptional regulator [Hydrogenophaga sp.]|uniref:LysR family transcriptional regulator n=1 Tax=Hydrogenophaga sp. TaxID=1904254 RepID=UPI0035682232
MRLRNADLNLLVAFDALMRECHVTRAANLLDISQSSMSLALAKLRVMFHDPLLIKSGNALIPTVRARELIPQVEQVLRGVDVLLHEQTPFDPAQANQVITMIVIDYIDFVVMPALMAALEREAPNVSLRVINPNPRRLGEVMSRGDIDLALSYFPTPPDNLRTRPLFTDRLVGIARAGHPMFERPLSLERFCEYGHVAIEPGEGATMYNALVDDALQNIGMQRRSVLSKPTFLGIPFVVAQTDLIATLPERLVQRFIDIAPVRIFEPPLRLDRLNVVLMWHDRTHNNPLHRWMRDLIAKLFAQ